MDTANISSVECTRNSYTLEIKKAIVAEAYAIPRNLRATAHKFTVQANQIRIWKRKFDENCAPALSHDTTGEGDKAKRFKKDNSVSRFIGGGRKCALDKDVVSHLEKFYDGKGSEDLGVTLRLMTAECRLV